jgi:microcystin-dependent protein
MSDQFVAEIRMFPFNFPPTGWAFCQGQLLPIAQNTALFSLLGTTYGGDGKTTFALPDMRGRAPMQPGQGPGLSLRDLGESSGVESITLLASEIPVHTHNVSQTPVASSSATPGATMSLGLTGAAQIYTRTTSTNGGLTGFSAAGGGSPHNNMQPYLTLNFCIALQGVFPPRG